MIITRTPLRISIGGGGTDLPTYYERFGGHVISAAINKYVTIAVSKTFFPGYLLRYSRLEKVQRVDDIQHPVIRQALRRHPLDPCVEIVSIADVPAGTGLGSSGTFAVGLLHALHAYRRHPVSAEALARDACHIQMVELAEPSGKQDPYIAAHGGIMCQEYRPDGSVEMSPLELSEATVRDLGEHLVLFFTGSSRESTALLEDQRTRSREGDVEMLDNLHFIKELGLRIQAALLAGDTHGFARLMHEHWLRKRDRSKGMSDGVIDGLYELGLASGALGGKLVGAGGGGFLLFYANDRQRLREAMATRGLQEMEWGFDFDGSQVVFRS